MQEGRKLSGSWSQTFEGLSDAKTLNSKDFTTLKVITVAVNLSLSQQLAVKQENFTVHLISYWGCAHALIPLANAGPDSTWD